VLGSVTYGDPVNRSRVLALVLVTLLSVLPAASPRASFAAAPGPGYRCVLDAFGQTADGRIEFRRVVNSRVEVAKTTRARVSWRPIAWGLVSSSSWPGHETTHQIVASTDGRVRLVETEWARGRDLSVRVLEVLGRGYPSRLVTFDDRSLYWVGADKMLHRVKWNGRRLVRPRTLPLSIRGATTMTSHMTDRGMRVYYTDRKGALHSVAVQGADSTDIVIRSSGYGTVTGLRAGVCMSPDYTRVRSYVGLLSVDRASGVGRFQRILRPAAHDGSTVTNPVRVPPSDWTWRRLG
jgi:hypothetical protein